MENLIISNKKKLNKKIKRIADSGADKLHILADFDKTLTKAYVNGEKIHSIISVLRSENYLTEDYPKKAYELFDEYHPIEINPEIPLQKKKKAMDEWWNKHFKLLIKCRLNKKDIERVIKSKKIELRQGVLEFLVLSKEKNIPIVIISANGLGGDSIKMIFEREKCMNNNIYAVSNSLIWDESGYAVSYNKPIIHSMNKDETVLKNTDVFNKIKTRKNIILLGDILEDANMAAGFDYEELIKIGFLNYDMDKNLEEYKKVYDVVILNDGSFDYINELIEKFN